MAASSDRLGVYINERPTTLFHDFPLASGEVLYEGTLAQLDSNNEFVSLSHTAGDDDSNVVPLAVLEHQSEDDPLSSRVHYDRGGTSPFARAHEGVLLELKDNQNDLSLYEPLETTVYAVDNETVSDTQADGSSGNRAPVGTVVRKLTDKGTLVVHVQGIAN